MRILLRINSPSIRKRIEEAGIKLCICCGFEETVWLSYNSDTASVHGVGYTSEDWDCDEVEEILADFEKECKFIDCNYDVKKFIQLCNS